MPILTDERVTLAASLRQFLESKGCQLHPDYQLTERGCVLSLQAKQWMVNNHRTLVVRSFWAIIVPPEAAGLILPDTGLRVLLAGEDLNVFRLHVGAGPLPEWVRYMAVEHYEFEGGA